MEYTGVIITMVRHVLSVIDLIPMLKTWKHKQLHNPTYRLTQPNDIQWPRKQGPVLFLPLVAHSLLCTLQMDILANLPNFPRLPNPGNS